MLLQSVIAEIAKSVQEGNPLTNEQYEVLAESSENETIAVVGSVSAAAIERAYNSYVVEMLAEKAV